jgi:hypothetical protein
MPPHFTGAVRLLLLVAAATLVLTMSLAGAPSRAVLPDGPGPSGDFPVTQSPTTSIAPSRIHEAIVAESSAGSEVLTIRVAVAERSSPRIAWIEKTRRGQTVWLDGTRLGEVYDEVRYLNFLGHRLTFIGRQKSSWALVADGEVIAGGYSKLTVPDMAPSGEIVVGGCREKVCVLLVEGDATGPAFEDIGAPDFSPAGDRLVYYGKRGKQWAAVIDGEETDLRFDGWATHRWGAGGARLATAAYIGSKSTWIVDGTPGPLFDVIGHIGFSADGRHFAYGGANASLGLAAQPVTGVIVVDGELLETTYPGRGMLGGWTYLLGSGQYISKGLKALSADFHGISDPHFTVAGELVFGQRLGDGRVVVAVGDTRGPAFDDIVSPVLVTGVRPGLAYVAKQGDAFIEVRDQVVGPSFPAKRDVTFVQWIAVTPQGRLMYELVRGGGEFKAGNTRRALRRLVVDGVAGPEYNALGIACRWSADERHQLCRIEGADRDRHRIVLDGLEGSLLYDDVSPASIEFPEEAATRFIARRGRHILHVTIAHDGDD